MQCVVLCPLDTPVRTVVSIYVCVCVCGLCAIFTAIIISLSAVFVDFSVAAPQITLLFDNRKFICKSTLRIHCKKNQDDQLPDRTINKIHCA